MYEIEIDVADTDQYFIIKEIDSEDHDMKTGTIPESINNRAVFDSSWFPEATSVYSETYAEAIPFTPIDTCKDLSWLPKITSVYSEASHSTTVYAPVNTELDVINNDVHRCCVPIEECPRCCTVLVPVQFTVNIVTAVMKTMCHCVSTNNVPSLQFHM